MSKDIRKMIDNVKNFKQFVNENRNETRQPISNFVIRLKDKYEKEYGINACDINKSECYNFAEELAGILLKNGYNDVEILTTELFRDMADEFQKEDDDEIFYNPLDYGGKRPINFVERFYSHAWVFVDGKHYDSDVPYGVENFYDLPTISQNLN